MAVGDIYTLTFNQSYGSGGKPIQNVFTYILDVGTLGAEALCNAFNGTVLPAINSIQTNHIKNISLVAVNLFSVTDFFTQAPAAAAGSGTGLDTVVRKAALNFTYKLDRRDIRPGSKRFAGLPESAVTNNVVTDSGYITNINALRLVLNNPIDSGGSTFIPVVVKRVPVAAVPGEHGAYYRFPENVGELDYGGITQVLVNLDMSSQGSR